MPTRSQAMRIGNAQANAPLPGDAGGDHDGSSYPNRSISHA